MKFMFGGILLVSQLVLVLMLMLDAYATGFLRRQKLQLYIIDSTNTRVVGRTFTVFEKNAIKNPEPNNFYSIIFVIIFYFV